MSDSRRIVSAVIGPMPQGFGDPMPDVTVKLDDGSEQRLFDFFPDEISFTEAEFVGLTVAEAHQLKGEKDLALTLWPRKYL